MNVFTRDLPALIRAVTGGYTYDPGSSDLDDKQPILVCMTLGDYRKARRLLCEIEKEVDG